MIKPQTFVLIALPLLFSCHQGKQGSTNSWPGVTDSIASGMLGSYSGHFKSGLLTLVINYVSGNTVSGYDLHRGIRRNINGRIDEKDGGYALVLKEPGGNPFDGTFFLSMDKAAQKLDGRWVPTDSSRTHSGSLTLSKSFDLKSDDEDYYYAEWDGDLGKLSFTQDNTCKLEYYPDSTSGDPNGQMITINGNYIKSVDTFQIDWQNNKHTPTLHMRLIRQHYIEVSSDSTIPENLHGGGARFVKNIAG